MKKHTHKYSSDDCRYYHLGGTRLWLFRKCAKCKVVQDAIVDTDKLIRWRPYNIKFPKS